MSMLEMIELVEAGARPYMMYSVSLIEFNQIETHKEERFFSKDDVITFLFDKDLFGWNIKSYDFVDAFNRPYEMSIVLYRVEK